MNVQTADLTKAREGSYYTILGAGGELSEWVEGYEKLMAEQEIGKPAEWFQTTGAAINEFAQPTRDRDRFPDDLTVLLFPIDGLNVGKLALFKVGMQDRWFDDVIDNIQN